MSFKDTLKSKLEWSGTGQRKVEVSAADRSAWRSLTLLVAAVFQEGPPRWPSGKASASRAEDPGFESRLRRFHMGGGGGGGDHVNGMGFLGEGGGGGGRGERNVE